jgi:hypothetical protein
MMKKPKPRLIPKKLGQVADLLYTERQTRLVEQGLIKDMQSFETRLKDHLIENLPKSDASGVAGSVARATVTTKKVPTVEDWELFYGYIKKKNAWDLLARSLNTAAATERLEAGEKIPGLGSFTLIGVSVTKL